MTPDSQPTSKTGNRVFLEEDIIHEVYVGDQDHETVAALNEATDKFTAELQAKQKPVLILTDMTDVGDQTQGARDAVKAVLGTRYFDRVAAFGVPSRLQIVGRILLTLTGTGNRVKIFDSREEAEAWLREFRPGD